MKRKLASLAAAALAIAMPATMAVNTLPTATAAPVAAKEKAADAKPAFVEIQPADKAAQDQYFAKKLNENKSFKWMETAFKKYAAGYNVAIARAKSPAMNDLEIPMFIMGPKGSKVGETEGLPTLYLLNGADGGQGRANWVMQSDIVEHYGENLKANIVIPMSGAFSYYTDWVSKPNEQADYIPKWETFLTKELPQALEPMLKANQNRAIAGMSMSATSSLNLAAHNPGFYDAVGSFSGCAATTSGLAPQFIDVTLNRGGTSMKQMWGGMNTKTARYNDALLNANKLKDQKGMYVSNSTGLAGPHDVLGSDRVKNNVFSAATVTVEGGIIEAATNACTHDFRAKLRSLGNKDAVFKMRPSGTHQWGYWEDDLRGFLPVLQKNLK